MNLSVSVPVYERYRQAYGRKREELAKKGITSFSGYVTSRLEEMMEKDEVFARHAPSLEEFGSDEVTNTVYVKDNRTGRIAGITIDKNKELHCDVDDRGDCVHVGFAYSLPEVYKVMDRLGVKAPKVRA
ncbi:MAG: hypothetical protein JRN17_01575 [Nitrososphaerota archaeon]|nr:hypothetical protein [Nitrososphaerota archaeon]